MGYDIPGCVEDGAWMLWRHSSVVSVAVVLARFFSDNFCNISTFLMYLFDLFFIFEFILRQLFLRQAPAVLGRRDGSIRALRKRRFRNKTREVVIFQIWVGDGGDGGDDGDDGGDGDGRISLEHPSSILHAPRS